MWVAVLNYMFYLRRGHITLRKLLLSTMVLGALLTSPVYADYQADLPNIGTAAAGTLSIPQEIEMGDFYLRQLRGQAPIMSDPLLSEYINHVGARLVSTADSVQTPFQFFLLNQKEINAFAFFGGNVVINTGLVKETSNESELASVMAHEISHVTQRHLARSMEQQKSNSPYTWAAALGSVLLGLANPELGVMALSSTIAGKQQSIISFTQSNEQEADRIGLRILTRAGYDPRGMPDFLQKLADQARFMRKPPEMLLTHPLPDTRLTDSRNRANQLKAVKVTSPLDYYLAKMRVLIYLDNKNPLTILIDEYKKGSPDQKTAARYGEGIKLLNDSKAGQAEKIAAELLQKYPNNRWFLDLATDADIEQKKPSSAIVRLEKALKTAPNDKVLTINLANAYNEAKNFQQAASLLHRYTHTYPSDLNGWALLTDAYVGLKKRPEELAARAESAALRGNLPQALTLLTNASNASQNNRLNQARYDSRIDQLRRLQQRYAEYER